MPFPQRWIDLAVILVYLAGITWFGARFRSSQRTLRDYFLGGKSVPWWAIALSIVSAETSTLTVIGTPPLAFRGNFAFLQLVMGYSATKRFTSLSHLVLGFALGIAPAAAWIAMRGSLDPRILWLTAAVTLWTAGFDIIYSCQDFEFDTEAGLFSIPRRFGIAGALWISRFLHLGMLFCLLLLERAFALGALAGVGIAAVAALLVYEHRLVKATDLSRVDAAFFTMNGYVSVIFFVFWACDVLWTQL